MTDDTDLRLIAALRRDGRAGLATLAADLGLSRNTLRARLNRLIETGEIQGFTVL
ncbi:Lrp/AsnC family transcriptional regulator, partial [Pararhodobacter marinus]